LPKRIPQCDLALRIRTPGAYLASAYYFADSVCTIKLSLRAEQGSTAKMPQCLQGDASRVMDNALHLVEQPLR